MLSLTIWRLITHYNDKILHLYEYSELVYQYEKKQTYFWYNMRTIFSPDFGDDDLLGDEIQMLVYPRFCWDYGTSHAAVLPKVEIL
jgi:hypothetical protein